MDFTDNSDTYKSAYSSTKNGAFPPNHPVSPKVMLLWFPKQPLKSVVFKTGNQQQKDVGNKKQQHRFQTHVVY